jgi:hypothetical protein
MANNFKAYEYFIGFRYDGLSFEEQAEVRTGMSQGYLIIDDTGYVRAA